MFSTSVSRRRARLWLSRATRDAAAATIAVGVFYAFYEMSGYWYDIGRPDSLGYALAAWGLFFCLRRAPGPGSVGAGLVLLAGAALTRQTLLPLGLCGGLWLLAKRPRQTRMALLGVGLVALNLAVLYRGAGNDWLLGGKDPDVVFSHSSGAG